MKLGRPSLRSVVHADDDASCPIDETEWTTGAEDFAFYGSKAPAFFFFVGIGRRIVSVDAVLIDELIRRGVRRTRLHRYRRRSTTVAGPRRTRMVGRRPRTAAEHRLLHLHPLGTTRPRRTTCAPPRCQRLPSSPHRDTAERFRRETSCPSDVTIPSASSALFLWRLRAFSPALPRTISRSRFLGANARC